MKTNFLKSSLLITVFAGCLTMTSCRDTNPGDADKDMSVTTDSIGGSEPGVDNNKSTEGADTELDGE